MSPAGAGPYSRCSRRRRSGTSSNRHRAPEGGSMAAIRPLACRCAGDRELASENVVHSSTCFCTPGPRPGPANTKASAPGEFKTDRQLTRWSGRPDSNWGPLAPKASAFNFRRSHRVSRIRLDHLLRHPCSRPALASKVRSSSGSNTELPPPTRSHSALPQLVTTTSTVDQFSGRRTVCISDLVPVIGSTIQERLGQCRSGPHARCAFPATERLVDFRSSDHHRRRCGV